MTNQLTMLDQLINTVDVGLRCVFIPPQRHAMRKNPADLVPAQETLSAQERHQIAALLRVNHAGEVCAQALYQGQALTARQPKIQQKMAKAALEEIDHLAWCEQRLRELESTPSLLNPVWYVGALMLGSIAGLIGDKWSLGFVAETERQVTAHLESHLQQLPSHDLKTHAIFAQMQQDELQHAESAIEAGAHSLPAWIQFAMNKSSKLMTFSSLFI